MTTQTPPRKASGTDPATTKIGIGLVVVLALVALVALLGSGSSTPGPMLLSASAPLRVTVPSINTTSTLIPLGQEKNGSLSVPPLSQPMQASWYDKSPMPGEIGPAVILGHVNGNGKPGVFLNLHEVQAGQQVLVDRADGQTAVFTVANVALYPKNSFPSATVYNDTPDSELRLITCGGELDREAHSYLSNVVVFANLTGVHKT